MMKKTLDAKWDDGVDEIVYVCNRTYYDMSWNGWSSAKMWWRLEGKYGKVEMGGPFNCWLFFWMRVSWYLCPYVDYGILWPFRWKVMRMWIMEVFRVSLWLF